VARLLGPGGCPWDREQTHQSIRKDLLEETYEALEALDAGDMHALAEELGDVLLHVLMHSEMARQAGEFDIGDVYEHIATKLIRRHPHVFGDLAVAGSAEVLTNWDAIKRKERAAGGQAPRGVFEGIPPGLPALMAAQETIRKASKAGFDSADQAWPWNKLHEEIDELHRAAHEEQHAGAAEHAARLEEEFGDLVLAASKLGYRLKIDAESALRTATAKFRRRFAAVERLLAEQGRDLLALDVEEKQALWRQAKDDEGVTR
jgi:tetrapyrrole methylase family protein/MazG family protein